MIEDFKDCCFELTVEVVRLRPAAPNGAVTDLMPTVFPLLAPLDRSPAGLANFIRNHRDLRFGGRG